MRPALLALPLLVSLGGCGAAPPAEAPPDLGAPRPEGALVAISLQTQVGVLLDELPAGLRDRAAAELTARPASFWRERAARQVELTTYRLVFRNFFHKTKGQLPLPPKERWTIELDPQGPARVQVDGHDLLAIGYTLSSTLLSDVASPAAAEPALAEPGGVWDEPFVLPIDPELLVQRTGLACMDESEFPPNSVDGENVAVFYDDQCTAAPSDCHLSEPKPLEDCTQALKAHVGRVSAAVHFERLDWDEALADQARLGEVSSVDRADLEVVAEGLENHRIVYRYIPAGSCALAEGCVGAPGWRRLLQFDASVRNVGGAALHIGAIDYYLSGKGSELSDHNLFEYSACHQHYHFSHYGDFTLQAGGEQRGEKRAFCLQSTQRYANNEYAPLTHPYGSCLLQGIQAGWGDDYGAGLDCQWIDITEVSTAAGPVSAPLSFTSNPDRFLCEGSPLLDEGGYFTFDPSEFTTADGKPVDRPRCEFSEGWDANNRGERSVTIPVEGGLVTAPCTRGQLGPRRDCGFARLTEAAAQLTCTPGASLSLSCQVSSATSPQVLRVCERSAALGTGVACVYRDALANEVVSDQAVAISLTCPSARDGQEPGGLLSLYAAPVLPGDPAQAVTCTVQ